MNYLQAPLCCEGLDVNNGVATVATRVARGVLGYCSRTRPGRTFEETGEGGGLSKYTVHAPRGGTTTYWFDSQFRLAKAEDSKGKVLYLWNGQEVSLRRSWGDKIAGNLCCLELVCDRNGQRLEVDLHIQKWSHLGLTYGFSATGGATFRLNKALLGVGTACRSKQIPPDDLDKIFAGDGSVELVALFGQALAPDLGKPSDPIHPLDKLLGIRPFTGDSNPNHTVIYFPELAQGAAACAHPLETSKAWLVLVAFSGENISSARVLRVRLISVEPLLSQPGSKCVVATFSIDGQKVTSCLTVISNGSCIPLSSNSRQFNPGPFTRQLMEKALRQYLGEQP